MTPEQVKLVQDSFAKVALIADKAAALLAPDVRSLFNGDMAAQGRKLTTTLAVVVNGLSNLASILSAARELATRHVHYGVQADHYQLVGASLLWTLEQGLGAHRSSQKHGRKLTRHWPITRSLKPMRGSSPDRSSFSELRVRFTAQLRLV